MRGADVLAVMDRGAGLARTMAGLSVDPIAKANLAEMAAARDAVAELIEASQEMTDADLSGDLTDEMVRRVRVALVRCGAFQ